MGKEAVQLEQSRETWSNVPSLGVGRAEDDGAWSNRLVESNYSLGKFVVKTFNSANARAVPRLWADVDGKPGTAESGDRKKGGFQCRIL